MVAPMIVDLITPSTRACRTVVKTVLDPAWLKDVRPLVKSMLIFNYLSFGKEFAV